MKPHYYLMKNKKILRLEEGEKFTQLSWLIQGQLIENGAEAMDQMQANWRVAIFRDEILELPEYVEYLNSPDSAQAEMAC